MAKKQARCNTSLYVPIELKSEFKKAVEHIHGQKCMEASVIRTMIREYVISYKNRYRRDV